MIHLSKPATYLLRLSVTIGAMALAFWHVPLKEVMPLLGSIAWPYLLAALVFTHVGQIISALRTRYYLHCEHIDFPVKPSLKLHYVGGLFNAFLPGGAGGDAYKAWWLKHHRQGKLLNMVKLMIASRLNGLWALGFLICILAYFSTPILEYMLSAKLPISALMLGGTIVYSIFASFVLFESPLQQLHAGVYSFGVQLAPVAVSFLLCYGLNLRDQALEYTILFMFSCILAMLPISIGGIGVRELALLHGSKVFGLSEHSGVTLAFTFTLLALTIPMVGAVVHHFYPPEKD